MNCKPGDLAVIVRGRNQNAWVRVIQRSAMSGLAGEPCWDVEALSFVKNIVGDTFIPGSVVFIEDYRLRPIPGDDAVDQFAREREVTT